MSIVGLLKRVSVFAELTPAQLEAVEKHAERRSLAKGEILITEGDRAKRIFVLVSGKLAVLSDGHPIAEVLPGEPVGEIAFFAGGLRTSDVIASRDSEVLQLDRPAYDSLVGEIPQLGDQILTVIARRMAVLTANAAPLPPREAKTIAIVPAGTDKLPDLFLANLRKTVEADPGCYYTERPGEEANALWLHNCEQRRDRLYTVCRETATEAGRNWLAFAIRNCDCVCLIADTSDGSSAAPSSYEPAIFRNAASCPVHVVLWSPEREIRQRRVAKWLARRPVMLRHHVWGDAPRTMARWLRFLTGEALGVVMSGGGALGSAHLGAVKALLEHGYEIDIYGGTSVGAAMAAALASTMPPDEIMDNSDEIFLHSKAMSRLSVPVYSLLDHHGFDAQLKKHYGDWDLEDLPLNFFAVSTSLTTNDMHIHRRGSLWKTVRASGSIPALLPPVIRGDGEVLVDGALIDNLPVDVMRQTKAGPNIILNFQDQPDWRVKADYSQMPTRIKAAWEFFTRRWKYSFPSIITVLSRTMVVTARRRLNSLELGDDVLIEMPSVPDMGPLDWKLGRQQFALAYETMSRILERANAGPDDSTERRLEVLREAASELSAKD